jgi:hypothetical protein
MDHMINNDKSVTAPVVAAPTVTAQPVQAQPVTAPVVTAPVVAAQPVTVPMATPIVQAQPDWSKVSTVNTGQTDHVTRDSINSTYEDGELHSLSSAQPITAQAVQAQPVFVKPAHAVPVQPEDAIRIKHRLLKHWLIKQLAGRCVVNRGGYCTTHNKADCKASEILKIVETL